MNPPDMSRGLPQSGGRLMQRVALPTKVAFLVVLVIVAMLVTEPVTLLVTLFVTVGVTLNAGIKMQKLLSSLKPLLLVIFLLFIFSAFTYDPKNALHAYARTELFHVADIGPVTVQLTVGGIIFGLVFVLKILLMMFGSVYVVASTPMEQILAGLNNVGAPAALGLMTMTIFRFIPTMTSEVETIKEAQRARGAGAVLSTEGGGRKKGKAVQGTIPLFIPMIVSAMRRSNTLAMSMVSRGFGAVKNPTQLVDIKLSAADKIFMLLLILALIAFVVCRFSFNFGIL